MTPWVQDNQSDHILIRRIGGGQAGERDGIKAGGNSLVELVPDSGQAGGHFAARKLRVRAEAGQRTVRRADDLADRIIGRLARQAVAAAFAVRSFDQSLLRQRAQDALKIFLRQFLPLV